MIEQYIRSLVDFSDQEIETVLSKSKLIEVEKKTVLVGSGDICKEVYFVLKGCIRLYCIKDGEDISECFFTEGIFASVHDSFISQKKARSFLETVEDCFLLSLSYDDLQLLYQEIPKMNELVRKAIEERFVYMQELFTSYILDTPEERYLKLIQYRPDIINRIPQHQIATFLGITPVSLSRIRNRLSKK